MEDHLSVSDARKLTGKSESTIKRMVREIVADPEHPDRDLIEPSHTEVERLRAAGERYTWGISEELLRKRFPAEEATASRTDDGELNPLAATGKLLDILREQLGQKDQQIAALEKQLDRKDEQLASLSERQRESNVLMKTLQERLTLDAPEPERRKKSAWLSFLGRP